MVRHVGGPTSTLLPSGDLHWDLDGGKWLSRPEGGGAKPTTSASAEAPEGITVSGAGELSGHYVQLPGKSYNNRPWWHKGGFNEDQGRQIWWNEGEWRIGSTSDHWWTNADSPPPSGSWHGWKQKSARGGPFSFVATVVPAAPGRLGATSEISYASRPVAPTNPEELWFVPEELRGEGVGFMRVSPWLPQSLSEDGLTVTNGGGGHSYHWSCHQVTPAITEQVVRASITFKVLTNGHSGSNGIYFGLTPADHSGERGDGRPMAACGARTSFVYRCRDGFKRVSGSWSGFGPHCTSGNRYTGIGVYGAQSRNKVMHVRLEYDRMAKSLRVYDDRSGHGNFTECSAEPLTRNLPVGDLQARPLYFFCDTCTGGQGATIEGFTLETTASTQGASSSEEPPVVMGTAVEATAVHAGNGKVPMTLMEQVTILKKELGLEGNVKAVIEQGAEQLGVPAEGQPLAALGHACMQALGHRI